MAAVLAIIAVTIAVRRDRQMTPAAAAAGIAASAPIPDFAGARLARPRYRHSVIAGGALTQEELAAAMREDAVVADHHKAVDIDRVRAIVTEAPRMAYVSYRIGHRVFWTRNLVQIPAGETLLTDGVTEIRGRCGNGISDVARGPVSDVEPPAAVLDAEEDDSSITGERTAVNTAPSDGAHVPFFQLAQESVLGGDAATGLPEEIRPVSDGPLALLGYLLDPPGTANDGTSLFGDPEPSARGSALSDPVSGGKPFLVGFSGLVGSDDPANGGGPNDGGSNGGGSSGGSSDDGGSNGGGSNGGGPNGGGPNDGGSNGGGWDDPGNPPTIYPGSEDLIEYDDDIPAIPEPGAVVLLGIGLAAAVARRRRR